MSPVILDPPSQPANFAYSAATLYEKVLNDLGGGALDDKRRDALRSALQLALHHIWTAHPWTWRRRSATISVTAGTPYCGCPSDWDRFELRRWTRADAAGVRRTVVEVPKSEFWQARSQNTTGQPRYFTVVWDNANGQYRVEFAPAPDGAYAWSDVGYFALPPALSWEGATTTPNMPTEFHGLWYTAALYFGAKALNLTDREGGYKVLLDQAVNDAVDKHDDTVENEPLGGVLDFYGDWNAFIVG